MTINYNNTMKTAFFVLLVAISSVVTRVRAQPNTVLLYGNVGFNSQKAAGVTATSYTFAPGVGYQWNDAWAGGINLVLNGSGEANGASSVSAGPFIRYIRPLSGIFAIYGQLNANYLAGNTGTTHYRGFQRLFFPAIGVNLKNSFALNFNVGAISFSSQRFDGVADPGSSLGIAFGSGVGFGLSKNFGLRN